MRLIGTSLKGLVCVAALCSANVFAQSPSIIWKRQQNSDRINTVIFNPTGDTLIAGSSDRLIKFWRVSDGTLLKTLNSSADYVHESAIESLSITSDGGKLASASYQVVKLWTLPEGTVKNLYGHSDWVVGVAFAPNGAYLASASFDHSVKIWRPSDGVLLRTLFPITDRQMRAVAFSPNSSLLAASGGDDVIHIWRTSDWTEIRQLYGHTDDIYTLTFSPDGTKIASGGYDRTVKIWNASTGTLLYTLGGNNGYVYGVAFTPDGTKLAYTDGEGNTVRVHRVSDGARLQLFTTEVNEVQTVAFSRNGLLGYGRVDNTTILASIGTTTTPPPPAQTNWSLTLNISGGGKVSVTPSPNGYGGTYTNGTIVRLTATAETGNNFVRWDGSVSSTSGTISLTMNGNKSVTAYFAATPSSSSELKMVWLTSDRKLMGWLMNGTSFINQYMMRNGYALSTQTEPVCLGDFNRDGHKDLLLRRTNGVLQVNFMNSTDVNWQWAFIRKGMAPTSGWEPAAAADFNRDGHSDILFEDPKGRTAVWYLNHTNYVSTAWMRDGYAIGPNWKVRAAADFNRDGYPDLLWQNNGGATVIWFMRNNKLVASQSLRNGAALSAGWTIRGAADFNQNGEMDILIQHADGRVVVWLMSGGNHVQTILVRKTGPSNSRVIGMK